MKVKDQPKTTDTPVVSISCISFNQEKYISNCLNGFLNQEVDFPVEILIHDDASSDKTPAIINEFAEKYPHIIKPLLQNENQFKKGVLDIHATFNFSRSSGKYIATCEGDDQWIDDNKLNHQVSFLEANKNFTLHTHECFFTSINYKNSIKSAFSILLKNLLLGPTKVTFQVFLEFFTLNKNFWNRRRSSAKRLREASLCQLLDVYMNEVYIPSLSILGKGDILRELPTKFHKTPTGHKEHIFWCALYGNIYHSNRVMGVRNQQENSLTVTNIHQKLLSEYQFEKQEMFLRFYQMLKEFAKSEEQIKCLERQIVKLSKK